jgi:xylose isomerase
MVHAHVGGADLCARAFLTAAKLIEDGKYDALLTDRYAGWQKPEAQAMLSGKMTLDEITAKAEKDAINPQPRSGKQEQIENLLMRSIYTDKL